MLLRRLVIELVSFIENCFCPLHAEVAETFALKFYTFSEAFVWIKGAVAKFGLFSYLPTNLSEICTQYVKLNQESIFAISFIYLIFFLLIIAFLSEKKTPFSPSTKKNRSR